jgi:hypothetical protein
VRKPIPISLPLRPVPDHLAREQALCPQCGLRREHQAVVLGRVGLRLVFRCTTCEARFFRVPLPDPPDEWEDPQEGRLGADRNEERSR